jgi:hypothetical protein
MPYIIHKKGNKFEVISVKTGKSHGLTTKKKATAQERLLRAIDHGWKPSGSK